MLGEKEELCNWSRKEGEEVKRGIVTDKATN